jgi:SOS-response transcriptional repressor LexA
MMKAISEIILETRKERKLSQAMLAEQLNQCGHELTNKAISKWENGQGEPSASVFIEICRLMGITDIYEACFGINPDDPLSELNEPGKQKVLEYASLLIASGRYQKPSEKIIPFERELKLFSEPVSAGTGNFLAGDQYQMITVGNDVPADADFGVRISGNSMEPRYINGQIVFIRQQNVLENGEIGIFLLDGEAYIKKLQNDSNGHFLISLNKDYTPIPIRKHSEFTILGKVIG